MPRRVHPRERGGARCLVAGAPSCWGPSPRARGSLTRMATVIAESGSIPASAGEPLAEPDGVESVRVHPRERGGAAGGTTVIVPKWGPSPRARGSPESDLDAVEGGGSIPASAGEPQSGLGLVMACGVHPRERGGARARDRRRARRWVHPRERGGAGVPVESATSPVGPSPRARGSRGRRLPAPRRRGSIPASAGEPATYASRLPRPRVHPRERGGARSRTVATEEVQGPSPRARGSRAPAPRPRRRVGSIPASAGEPDARRRERRYRWVHPRERGGAWNRPHASLPSSGPSPRARGSRWGPWRAALARGSIPASAGEPARRLCAEDVMRVHPRERGGADARPPALLTVMGPSPRARGSRGRGVARGRAPGSIPASAGEPDGALAAAGWPWVHPRERGGARSTPLSLSPAAGPSPRARGSRRLAAQRDAVVGSIPASAGEPTRRGRPPTSRRVHPRERGGATRRGERSALSSMRVHPRERGGAALFAPRQYRKAGPSPRARGSPQRLDEHLGLHGSIPASAGEPPSGPRTSACGRVHPRERGGANSNRRSGTSDRVHPRERGGALAVRLEAARYEGSIPASAGEPASRASATKWRRVHPRERGGARFAP